MLEKVTESVQAKVNELMANGITLQARRTGDGRLEIPVSTTCIFALTFTLPELKELGVDVRVHTPEGRAMHDDELAEAILHADKQK